ncbi:MAG: hypothetical protein B7Z73_09480 [Planctomycetia bacterium 21-64-5]|nr:MAG: hypothetical protein B7Z73_09480 [Planctomycetia bacterium 21-64-5]HQU45278.1 hypothetical protein [Pirellulales bacterium]
MAGVAAVTVAATVLGLQLGSEFIPKLREGTIVITTIRIACDTFLTMLALPVLYLLFGKGPAATEANAGET